MERSRQTNPVGEDVAKQPGNADVFLFAASRTRLATLPTGGTWNFRQESTPVVYQHERNLIAGSLHRSALVGSTGRSIVISAGGDGDVRVEGG